ncbi:hypothetical protein BC938DRAFT_475388 [Jimgerdemannia flammicorona]|uniref:Ribonucleases P/MRP subunit Pop8-like domain-containing protein n=1 Tax=Jimgerdemannia flammicorona TaxID=994334 RepID=A0A433PVL8_9FUNG|nr:hypothetical protein BC938DRAFT_475388 [Jimgerdemannia flammicorona]
MVSDSTTQKPASAIPLTRLAISPSEWHYLKVKITSEHTLSEHIDNLAFRLFIAQALGSTYGIVGSALFVDVLDWDDDALVGILKVASGAASPYFPSRSNLPIKRPPDPLERSDAFQSDHRVPLLHA